MDGERDSRQVLSSRYLSNGETFHTWAIQYISHVKCKIKEPNVRCYLTELV